MARLKTAYRPEKIPAAETPAPRIPEIKNEPPQPSETVRVEFATDKVEPSVAIVSADEYPSPDEATLALQKQLADLRKSEEMQRNYALFAAQQAQRPMSWEQKLATWRANGGDEGDISFLESHPEMIDRHDVTVVAAEEAAQQGFERGTDAHRQATKEIFDRHLGHQQAQPAASAGPAASTFFEPSESPRLPAGPDRSAIVSAPVSWREAGGYREPSLRSVKLSPIEQEMARNLGLSDVAYAEGKIRMLKAKANGELQ